MNAVFIRSNEQSCRRIQLHNFLAGTRSLGAIPSTKTGVSVRGTASVTSPQKNQQQQQQQRRKMCGVDEKERGCTGPQQFDIADRSRAKWVGDSDCKTARASVSTCSRSQKASSSSSVAGFMPGIARRHAATPPLSWSVRQTHLDTPDLTTGQYLTKLS